MNCLLRPMSIGLALAMATNVASAQLFDLECQRSTQESVVEQMGIVCGANPAGCSALQGFKAETQRYIDEGDRRNAQYTETLRQVAKQVAVAMAADVEVQKERSRLERLRETVDPRGETQVRDLQRKLKEFDDRINAEQNKMILADPRVDRKNAELTKYQIGSDEREGEILRNRALIGVPDDVKQKFLAQAAVEGVRSLGLPSDLQELAEKSQATRDAFAGYAVVQSIAASGTIDKKLEYIASRGMTPFDTQGDVLVEPQARNLTGGMAIKRIDNYWGGSPQHPELRRNMGPESRAAINAAGARANLDNGLSLKTAQTAREAMKRNEIPKPPPEARGSPEDGNNYLKKVATAARAAVTETVAEIKTKIRVPGTPEIIPRSQR